jgi:hypothetical protein
MIPTRAYRRALIDAELTALDLEYIPARLARRVEPKTVTPAVKNKDTIAAEIDIVRS